MYIEETRNDNKIISNVNELFDEQEEKYEVNTITGKVKNKLNNIATYNRIKKELNNRK